MWCSDFVPNYATNSEVLLFCNQAMLIFFGQLWNAMVREKADHSIEANQGWGMCGDTCEDQEVFVIIIIIINVMIIIVIIIIIIKI